MNKQRRIFMLATSVVSLGLTTLSAQAQDAKAPPLVAENDPTAAALGYVADATKTDKKKYPQYATGQDCLTCQLYQGKPKDAAGGCPLFAGKEVTAKGWCSAWVKKAA
jgi:hypothetical protein